MQNNALNDDLYALTPTQHRVNGMGTGIIVDPRGYVVTNHHVIEEVNTLRVRLIDGTVIGAVMVVVLGGFFPQDGLAFLGLLAVWGGICAFGATVLGNFASYAAACAGFTAVLIACASFGETGGGDPHIFLAAVTRASTICLGAACATIVVDVTDLGGARRQLAASLANLAAEIAGQHAAGQSQGQAKRGAQRHPHDIAGFLTHWLSSAYVRRAPAASRSAGRDGNWRQAT